MAANAQCESQFNDASRIKNIATQPTYEALAVQYQLVTQDTNFILVHERSAHEKAQEMPAGHRVPQMLAAGWGGSGTVHACATEVLSPARPRTQKKIVDYAGMSTPSVWRTSRSQSIKFGKNPPSASVTNSIPQFSRKESSSFFDYDQTPVRRDIDKVNPMYWVIGSDSGATGNNDPYIGFTPAGLDHWLSINNESLWPASYSDLENLGLGLAICEWLEFELGDEHPEATVVSTFLMVLRAAGFDHVGAIKSAVKAVQGVISSAGSKSKGSANLKSDLALRIRTALQAATANSWPEAWIVYPQLF